MKRLLAAALLLLAAAFPAAAQEYYDIDVDIPEYPEMQPIPDSPVYYAPMVDSNYFFYDGLYWDYYNDGWYSSPWYNGPWAFVDPIYVPTYVLWVPIRYYRKPPHHWHGWNVHRPPRWSQHWGRDWHRRHNDVYRGNPAGRHARAPLPDYQRSFNRSNYPRAPQQQSRIHAERYPYHPQERTVQHYSERRGMGGGAQRLEAPQRIEAPQRTEPQRSPESGANPAARGDRGAGERGGRDRDRR
jgi:hypothetical protein